MVVRNEGIINFYKSKRNWEVVVKGMSNGRVRILILSSYILESRIMTIIKEKIKV